MKRTVRVSVGALADEWEWALLALAKTISVSRCQLQRLPWETHCFGEAEKIAGISETVAVPAPLLQKNKVARQAVLKLFDGMDRSVLTFAFIVGEVTKVKVELLAIDRSFAQEVAFLIYHAEDMVMAKVREQAISVMPTADQPCTIAQSLEKIMPLKTSFEVLACQPALLSDIDALVSLLVGLQEGKPPSFASLLNLTEV